MCLGEVAQVVELGPDSTALVRSPQRTATVSLLTLEEPVVPGDWVVCHSGFALGRVTPAEAAEAAEIRSTTASPPTTAPTPITPTSTVPPRKDPQ